MFWLPTRPYSAVDAVNRAALATGSHRIASIGAHADYNGHQYRVYQTIRDQRAGTYTVNYTWGGLNYVARGVPLAEAVGIAVEHASQGRGGSVIVEASGPEAEVICRSAGLVPYEGPKTEFDHTAAAMPWQCGGIWHGHTSVGHAFVAVRMEREQGISTHLFLEATSYEDWQAKVEAAREARRAR